MHIIARIHPGPAWLPGKSVFEQGPVMNEHLAFMRARFDDGSLRIGGPLATEESGLALFEAADLTAARNLVNQNPAAEADVLVYELHQLLPYSTRSAAPARKEPQQTRPGAPDPRLTFPASVRPGAIAAGRTPPR